MSTIPPTPIDHVPAREGYDRWAEIYDTDDNPLVKLEEPRMHDLLGGLRGKSVLDLGCGTGRHTIRLADAEANVTAVDFSAGMLDKAKAKPGAERVRFVVHDLATPLPLPPESFDRIACGLVLDHIADLPSLFGEVRRLLKPDGWAVLSTVHPAMMLRGVQARFTDPVTGRETRPASASNQISDYVMAALGVGLKIDHFSEHAADEELARRCPRAEKYVGWPMLVMMRVRQ
jgi:ubiquinone/menaquinone biosynthesis C-methylase UbiE